jgi:radical SAM protein with 4Fe4S-binding SPASM domain
MQKPTLSQAVRTAVRLLFKGRYTLTFDQLEFHQDNIPFQKRINHLLQGVQLLTRTVHRICIPPILQLEPSNLCNLNCLTCVVGAQMMSRPSALMPAEMYRNIIDQVKNFVHLLVFWSWGEPFTNKDAISMIRYAKDQGLLVHTSTNGHFFQKREQARQVVDSGLDSLVVAVDGIDQATYEKYRKGGRLNLVIKSIENLVAERISVGVTHPLITFRFIVMKHNEHQINRVRDFAKQLGVDLVSFRSAVVQRCEVNLEDRLAPNLAEFQQFTYEGSPSAGQRIRQDNVYCHRPYANLTVFSNGDVVSCENDFNATIPFGNVSNQSLNEILSSKQARVFFEKFRENLDHLHFCKDCEIRDMKHQTHNVQTHILNREIYKREKTN